MIIFLREKFIAQIFMGLIAFVFVIGTVFLYSSSQDPLGRGTDNRVVLEINNTKVQQSEFENLVSDELQRQQQQSQGRVQVEREQVERQVIDQLINRQLLLGSIRISDAEIDRYIRSNSNLLLSYNFYQQQGGADAYRQYVRVLISDQTLRNQIQGLELVTDTEVENEYYRQNNKAKLKFIQFKHFQYNRVATVDDAEAAAYFEEQKEDYKKADTINLRFIKLAPKNFVSDEAVQAYYNENKGDFTTPEVVKARHILKKFPDNATEEQKAEVRAESEKVLETVKAAIAEGQDFAELAKAHSEDTGSAANGGALRGSNPDLPPGDYFARGDMVKPFEQSAFDELKPGEVSDLVETRYGYHIIKLEEKRPEEVKPFEQAKIEIKNKLVQIAGVDEAKTISEDLLFDVEIQDYDEAVKLDRYKDLSLTFQDTGLFEEDESNIPKIGSKWAYRGLIEKIFDMEVNVSDIIETKKSSGDIEAYFVAKVLEKQPAAIPEFDTVKNQVIDDIKTEKAKQIALEDAQKLLGLRGDDESLEDLVKKYEAPEGISKKEQEVKEGSLFALSPSSNYVSGMGTCREAMFVAFEMELNEVQGPFQGDNSAYIIQLVEQQAPDMEKFQNDPAEKARIRKALLQTKQSEVYNNWLAALKKQAKIVDKRSES
ncbi:MAG: peptidyl-prolyl cis-trans isomerase [Candidatus Poribacteria bacterium]|nr:peptidyl-prolyl cis-trans isomerase [Candidatus Poribacteria bacterium]